MAKIIENSSLLMGQMMSQPLLISGLLTHAARHHADTEIVSRRTEGDIHRYTYADCHTRAKKVAQMLDRMQIAPSARIGTFAWNGYRHLEIYYGVSGSARVCHTINPRLFAEQLHYIVNHAEDQVVFFDTSFLPLIESIHAHCPTVKHWICMTDADHMPKSNVLNIQCYESLLAQESGDYEWPTFDERAASSLCYTSGTTGNPKGALYSHRSTILHSYAVALPDSLGITARESIMPVVPMFHVNAWGIPYACPLAGARIVFPGPKLDGASLCELIEQESVTMSAGVPTIWAGLIQHVIAQKIKFTTFKRTVIGGSACPPAMIQAFEKEGVQVIHAWGMTELSPVGSVAQLKQKDYSKRKIEQDQILAKQGRPMFGVDIKIVDEKGLTLPHDGIAFGDLLAKSFWAIDSYFGAVDSPLIDGWFPTGDVATIDPDSHIQITDRSKDVIKSGGEWISSIELENVASAHPEVAMAACIAIAHPKWDERPLLVVVKRETSTTDSALLKAKLLEMLAEKVAKWWLPDDIVFVKQIPLTATGKMAKLKLREEFVTYKWPV
jgi:acyl-CoA synthetase (AMP-forming)/AMP-acid ligase II